LSNLVHYEVLQVARSAFVALRIRLLESILARGADWPAWLPELAAREIYEKVKDRYHPGEVNARLIVVRAHDGSGNDLPAADVVADPLLGWGDRSRRGLDVIDAPGGHSSMLQEPHVGSVAERLMVSLVTATKDNPIGGQTKAHAARR
jgi:thioesterase domain-containing protein